MKYDTIVFIGRFQPFHNAHLEIVKKALEQTNRLVILVGSSFQPKTYKNPWSFDERKEMILSSLEFKEKKEIHIHPLMDSIHNEQAWIVRVQEAVASITTLDDRDDHIAIIGHQKDSSSYYLNMFPQWDFIDVELQETIHATDIRDLYFRDNVNLSYLKNIVPGPVYEFLKRYLYPYDQIVKERKFIENYRKQYSHLPYAPTFVTTDAVVLVTGHVLLIERKAEPGKHLWALPGGFLNADTDKSLKDAMVRELKEETNIKVPVPVLLGSITDSKVFDAIGRSARGRTITHAFKIELADKTLPKIRAGDDAGACAWIPVGLLNSEMIFEDHYEIIQYFVGI